MTLLNLLRTQKMGSSLEMSGIFTFPSDIREGNKESFVWWFLTILRYLSGVVDISGITHTQGGNAGSIGASNKTGSTSNTTTRFARLASPAEPADHSAGIIDGLRVSGIPQSFQSGPFFRV